MSGVRAQDAGPGRWKWTRLEWLLFAASLLGFAWFHPGGGWNQNARFALVRAIVEEGRLDVDAFLVYEPVHGAGRSGLARRPIEDGQVTLGGRRVALYWRDVDGRPVPLTSRFDGRVSGVNGARRVLDVAADDGLAFSVGVPSDARVVRDGVPVPLAALVPGETIRVRLRTPDGRRAVASEIEAGAGVAGSPVSWKEPGDVAATGDLSFHGGHFHPAKAPGGSFLAVPAYLAVHAIGRMTGADPDDWWTLTVRAWLTSVLSVGVLGALTVVVVLRLALRLSDGEAVPALLAAIAFAFGTPFFAYSTMLYEHAAIAFLVGSAFALLWSAGEATSPSRAARLSAAAGAMAGAAAVANYAMLAVGVLLLGYLVLGRGRRLSGAWFCGGLLVPLLLLAAYNLRAFGTAFTTNYAFEDPQFLERGDALLGVFRIPDLAVVPLALFSPFRGLFLAAPVLALGAVGIASWFRSGRQRAAWWLVVSVLSFFLALLTTFNGWHGGWGASPRYLVPAIPFLAFPAVLAFARARGVSSAVATASVALNLLVVAVDPQAPVGLTPLARIEGLPDWAHSPITLYAWPLFVEGRASPILDAQRDAVLRANDAALASRGAPPAVRASAGTALRGQIDGAIARGEPAPLLLQRGPQGELGIATSDLPTVVGPVSANPGGIYEAWRHRAFPPGSVEARRNAFNVGELLFPESRLSLVPLLLAELLLLGLALRAARRLDDAPP